MGWNNLPDDLENKVQSSIGGEEGNTPNRKYNNKKPEIDGHKFDSKKEGRYYEILKILESAGEVEKFELQPKFRLQDGFDDKNGDHHRPINYYADFKVWWKGGKIEIIDVKGSKKTLTSVYKIKKKMLLKKYPDISFREIYNVKL